MGGKTSLWQKNIRGYLDHTSPNIYMTFVRSNNKEKIIYTISILLKLHDKHSSLKCIHISKIFYDTLIFWSVCPSVGEPNCYCSLSWKLVSQSFYILHADWSWWRHCPYWIVYPMSIYISKLPDCVCTSCNIPLL